MGSRGSRKLKTSAAHPKKGWEAGPSRGGTVQKPEGRVLDDLTTPCAILNQPSIKQFCVESRASSLPPIATEKGLHGEQQQKQQFPCRRGCRVTGLFYPGTRRCWEHLPRSKPHPGFSRGSGGSGRELGASTGAAMLRHVQAQWLQRCSGVCIRGRHARLLLSSAQAHHRTARSPNAGG